MLQGTVGNRPLQLYLLTGDTQNVLLDTGCAPDPERLIFPYLKGIGLAPVDISLVINTHSDLDHCGGNHAVKQANPDVLLSCGDLDRSLIEEPQQMWTLRYNAYFSDHGLTYEGDARKWILEMLGSAQNVDITWRGGETLRLGRDWVVEIHHTPGHSPGHLSVFDPRSETLLSGDAVQESCYLDVAGKPVLCPTYTVVKDYLSVIQKFRTLPVQQLASCHWPIKTGRQIFEFLEESERFVKRAEQALIESLREARDDLSLLDLITLLSPRLGEWPRSADMELMYAIYGNLRHLVQAGQVEEVRIDKPVRYRFIG